MSNVNNSRMVKMCVELKPFENNENLTNNHTHEEQNGVDLDMDSEDEVIEADDDLKLKKIAGGSLVNHAPILHPSGGSFFLICKDVIKFFSSTTGVMVWEFECTTEGEPIVNAEISFSRNIHTLVGCTMKGKVMSWNLFTGKQNGDIVQLELNDNAKVKTFNLINFNDCAAVGIKEADGRVCVCIFNLENGKNIFKYKIPMKSNTHFRVAISAKAHKLMAVAQQDQLTVLSTDPNQQHLKTTFWNMNNIEFTTLVFHPIEDALATGDNSGRVIIWRDFFTNEKRPFREVYHWHHSAVKTIAFTEAGTIFYSGGYEAVLVKWNYNNVQNKDFLARLSAPIAHISYGGSQIVLATLDNAIQIYNPQFKLQQMVQDFTWAVKDFTGLSRFQVGLKINPRTQSLVLNGRVGHLQFFSTYTNRLLYNLDVTMANYLCPERTKLLFNTRVTHCCLNNDWIATAEYWTDFENSPEVRIKFFAFNEAKQSFALNTNVEMPHNTELVGLEFSHAYSSADLVCASAGHDLTIKIWALENSPSTYRQGKAWMCVNVLTYKNLPVFSINFSRDGSILAAGFGNILCLWDTSSWKLKQTLSAPPGADGHVGKLNIFIPRKPQSMQLFEQQSRYQKLIFEFLEGENEDLIKDVSQKLRQRFVTLKKEPFGEIKEPDAKTTVFKKVSQCASYLSIDQKAKVLGTLRIPIALKGEDQKPIRYLFQKHKRLHHIQRTIKRKVLALPRLSQYPTFVKLKAFLRNPAARISRKPKWVKRKPRVRKINSQENSKDSDDKDDTEESNSESSRSESEDEKEAEEENVTNEKFEKNGVTFRKPKKPDVVKSPAKIRFISFGSNDFSHLLIICTDHRVIVWNLLTLRIEASVADDVTHLSVDPLTNLVAIVTRGCQLKVFHINDLVPIYKRSISPINGMVWVPRRQPKGRTTVVDWQATSQLVFLNKYQELVCLKTAKEYSGVALYEITKDHAGGIENQTAFATILSGETKRQTARQAVDWTVNKLTGKGLNAVKEFTLMQTHAMAPLHLLCDSFMRSLAMSSGRDEVTTNGDSTATPTLGTTVSNNKNDDTSDEETKNENQTDEDSVTPVKQEETDENLKVLKIEKRLNSVQFKFLNEFEL